MKTERMTVEEYLKTLKKNKFGNTRVMVDGIEFQSKKEADRYSELKLLQKAGVIEGLKLQVTFELIPAQPDEKAVKYIADFVYIEHGKTIAEDAKGFRTKDYIIKRKLFKHHYPGIEFREV